VARASAEQFGIDAMARTLVELYTRLAQAGGREAI